MGAVFRVFLWVLICYGLYCLVVFLFQRSLVFPRYLLDAPTRPETENLDLERWWLETASGRVEAWFLPPAGRGPQTPSPAVIFAHGNAEIIDLWPHLLRGFTDMGLGLLLVEYPGYGRSEGYPSQESIINAFLAGYDRLVHRPDVDADRIVLFGRSLGGGVVCALAARRPSAAMILLSTFTSIRSFSWRFLVPPFLVKDPFDNLAALQDYDGPVLVLHGHADQIVPFRHGKALAEVAGTDLVRYNCGHNDCPPDWSAFWTDVRRFLQKGGIVSSTAIAPDPCGHRDSEGT